MHGASDCPMLQRKFKQLVELEVSKRRDVNAVLETLKAMQQATHTESPGATGRQKSATGQTGAAARQQHHRKL